MKRIMVSITKEELCDLLRIKGHKENFPRDCQVLSVTPIATQPGTLAIELTSKHFIEETYYQSYCIEDYKNVSSDIEE